MIQNMPGPRSPWNLPRRSTTAFSHWRATLMEKRKMVPIKMKANTMNPIMSSLNSVVVSTITAAMIPMVRIMLNSAMASGGMCGS